MDAANDGFIPRHSDPHGVNTPTHIQASDWQYQCFFMKPKQTNFFSCSRCLRRKLASLHFNQCNKSPNYLMMNIWTINRQHGFQDFENVSLSWDKFSWHSKLYVPRCCPDPFHLTFPSIASTTNEHLNSSNGPPTHIIYNEWMLSKLSLASTNFCFPKLSG